MPKGYVGITLFPFIVIRDKHLKQDKCLLNHECIHLRQQLELLVLPFFIWYGLEFMIRLLQYRNRYLAYKNISFEREAYSNETDLEYLQSRPVFRFAKYL